MGLEEVEGGCLGLKGSRSQHGARKGCSGNGRETEEMSIETLQVVDGPGWQMSNFHSGRWEEMGEERFWMSMK